MVLIKQDNGIMPHAAPPRVYKPFSAPPANPHIHLPVSAPKGFYICYVDKQNRYCGFSKDEAGKKILHVGGSGYGKTNAFFQMLDEILKKPGNKVNIIFDSKGDFLRRYGTGDPNKEAIVSHRHSSPSDVRWNVFSEILASEDDYDVAGREIAKMLLGKKYYQENRQKFFVDAAVEILSAAIRVLLADYYATSVLPTNADLIRFLSLSPESILARTEEYGFRESIDLLISEAQEGGYTGQTLGIIGEVKNVVNDLFVGSFAQGGDYSIRSTIKTCAGTVNVFIEYDVNLGRTLAPIYTCLITNAIKETLGRTTHNCSVNLFIDEWSLLEKIPDMDTAISFGREPGLFIAAAFQHIGKMKEIYGEYTAEGMLNGFHNLIVFNSEDKDTRDYSRKRIGTAFQERIHYASLSSRSVSYAEETIIRDEDITSLGIGEALVIPGTAKTITRFQFKNVKD